MNMVKTFGKPIRVNKAASDRKESDIGANLFVGNLDPEVDEKTLFDTFSGFGRIIQTPKVRFARLIGLDCERNRFRHLSRIRICYF